MTFSRLAVSWMVLMICVLLPGCGGTSTDDYVPSPESARSALEKALTAWKNGEPQGTVESGEVKIEPLDTRWRDGQQIESFTIVEELPGDPHPKFKVTLRFKDALEDEEATYIVFGIDPIQVYRAEDYETATGM